MRRGKAIALEIALVYLGSQLCRAPEAEASRLRPPGSQQEHTRMAQVLMSFTAQACFERLWRLCAPASCTSVETA